MVEISSSSYSLMVVYGAIVVHRLQVFVACNLN